MEIEKKAFAREMSLPRTEIRRIEIRLNRYKCQQNEISHVYTLFHNSLLQLKYFIEDSLIQPSFTCSKQQWKHRFNV